MRQKQVEKGSPEKLAPDLSAESGHASQVPRPFSWDPPCPQSRFVKWISINPG
jgi:hypothetical protein